MLFLCSNIFSQTLQGPRCLHAVEGDSNITLHWEPVQTPPDIQEYRVYRNLSRESNYQFIDSVLSTETSYIDRSVLNANIYYYIVTVKDTSYNESTYNFGCYGVAHSNADSDNDGLPDDWEQVFWGDLSNNGSDDPDNDGLTNYEEYMAGEDSAICLLPRPAGHISGTNPTESDSDYDFLSDGADSKPNESYRYGLPPSLPGINWIGLVVVVFLMTLFLRKKAKHNKHIKNEIT